MKLVGWEQLLDDLNLIIQDIRETHKKDSESAPQTTVTDELKENLEAVEIFKGSFTFFSQYRVAVIAKKSCCHFLPPVCYCQPSLIIILVFSRLPLKEMI